MRDQGPKRLPVPGMKSQGKQQTTINSKLPPSLTHPLEVLEASATAGHDAELERRPHGVQSVLVTQLLVLQLSLRCRANLRVALRGGGAYQQ